MTLCMVSIHQPGTGNTNIVQAERRADDTDSLIAWGRGTELSSSGNTRNIDVGIGGGMYTTGGTPDSSGAIVSRGTGILSVAGTVSSGEKSVYCGVPS